MWTILFLSFLSGLCTPFGALLVLHFRTLSQPVLAFILALASGVMLTVVAIELLPASIKSGGWWWFALGCSSGLLLMSALGDLWRHRQGEPSAFDHHSRLKHTGQFVALAIAVHDLPEGMAIGAADAVHAQLGIVIALAMALHNMPEGMSIAAPLHAARTPRRKILGLTVLISLVTPLGTLLPLIGGKISPTFSAFVLAFASGAMLYVVAHDTLPESWQEGRKAAGLGLLAGAGLMAAMARLHSG